MNLMKKLPAHLAFFVSRLVGGRVCGRQRQQKANKTHTEQERVQFRGTAEHERGPCAHATREKIALNTRRCSFGIPLNTRGHLTTTPHGALKGTKARARTEKTLTTIPGCTIVQLMQMSDSVPFRCYILIHLAAFRVLCFVAACVSSGSCKSGFYCGFLFNSPHVISQSMKK